MKSTPHYEAGTENKIAVIFSCPGRYEEAAGRPAARMTGRNLEVLLEILNKKLGTDDFTREKITITNSWDRVEYPAKTGRSEATAKELLSEKNLKRIIKEITYVTKFIIVSGFKASIVIKKIIENDKISKNIKIVYIPHLGMMSLNLQIKSDVHNLPIKVGDPQATFKRLEKIAEIIINELK